MKNQCLLLALLLMLFPFCRNSSQSLGGNNSQNDVPKVQLTAYSAEHELFAELDPFIEGKTSSILAHFTALSNFKPLLKGKISFSLIIDDHPVTQEELSPIRPGIYLFSIIPKYSGRGQLIINITDDDRSDKIMLNNIVVFKNEIEARNAEPSPVSNALAIVFTKEKSWKVDFATALPDHGPFGQIIKTTAQVQSTQGDEVILAAKTHGLVKFTREDALEGKSVSIGQSIFSISGGGIADNNLTVRFSEAQNNFQRAKIDYERAVSLAKDKIVSEKELLKTKNEYDNARAIFDNLNKNFIAGGQIVSSPFNGFIKQIFVRNGQYVNAGQPIITISQNRSLLLRADVSQKFVPILSSVVSATLRTIHDNQTYTLEQLNGKILSYGRNTNSDNYLIPVSLQVDNRDGLFPGGFVELYLKTMTDTDSLSVPNSALQEDQGNYYVFVQLNPELFEKREVKPGPTDGLKTEIISGIEKNERIVTKGAIWVKLAQVSGALDAHSGHVH